jgi:hypothetical protein
MARAAILQAALQTAFPEASFSANFWSPGRSGREGGFRRYKAMTDKAIQDLVGRVMIDREFLAELVRDPDVVLADYELTAEERAIIMQALGRGAHVSAQERAHALRSVMLKRWAT